MAFSEYMNFKKQEPYGLLNKVNITVLWYILDCNLKQTKVKVLFRSRDFILQIKFLQFLSEEQVKIENLYLSYLAIWSSSYESLFSNYTVFWDFGKTAV